MQKLTKNGKIKRKFDKTKRSKNEDTQTVAIRNLKPKTVEIIDKNEVIPSDFATVKIEILNVASIIYSAAQNKLVSMDDKEFQALCDCISISKTAPAERARKAGILFDEEIDAHPELLAKNRTKRLTRACFMAPIISYVENTDENKKRPKRVPHILELGAVDKQMAYFESVSEEELVLRWKFGTKEFRFTFDLPEYISEYHIEKFCLPSIYYNLYLGTVDFQFALVERLHYNITDKTPRDTIIIAAYDLGRVKEFSVCIMMDKGKVLARIDSPKNWADKEEKLKNLKENRSDIDKKIKNATSKHKRGRVYTSEEINDLRVEKRNLDEKIKNLKIEIKHLIASALADICVKYNVDICVGEDLTWVSENKSGSSWRHGEIQDAIEVAVHRVGAMHVTISPAFSSQTCVACGFRPVDFLSELRLLVCPVCGHSCDRDRSAAEFLASRVGSVLYKHRMVLRNSGDAFSVNQLLKFLRPVF